MSDVVIKVESLGKKYVIGHRLEHGYVSLRDVIAGGARRFGSRLLHPFGAAAAAGSNGKREEFWALKDVSFDVRQGEVVGIVGRNGAGKSTLLKVLSRITEPTAGRVRIRGRVASLLEVGTGFHPELTGRENIFLNGAILGMSKAEIKHKFDEIVAFAEIEKFLDTPVKRYSSGMYVRLAFAVAAHLEPEILLVDEVLAVGDAQFHKKCLGKMGEVSREGRTVLFVSHNMASIKRLCTSAMCLANGRLVETGEPHSVITGYLQEASTQDATIELPDHLHLVKSPIQIKSVEILNSKSVASGLVLFGEDIFIKLAVRVTEQISQVRIGVGLYAEGIRIATIHSSPIDFRKAPGLQHLVCKIPGDTLMPNFYSLHVGAYSFDTGRGLDWVPDAISFRIESVNMDGAGEYDPKDYGLIRLKVSWETVLS